MLFNLALIVNEMPVGATLRLIRNSTEDYDIHRVGFNQYRIQTDQYETSLQLRRIFSEPLTPVGFGDIVSFEELTVAQQDIHHTLFEYQENRKFQSVLPDNEDGEWDIEMFILDLDGKYWVGGHEGLFYEVKEEQVPDLLNSLPIQKVLTKEHVNLEVLFDNNNLDIEAWVASKFKHKGE